MSVKDDPAQVKAGERLVRQMGTDKAPSAVSKRAQQAAERWRQGTEDYQKAYAPVAQRIHERAKEMSGDDPAAIVAMAIEETTNFARDYHNGDDDQGTDNEGIRASKTSG